jgi:hypothetical protein
LKVIPSITLMLLKIVAYMDDPQRRAKDLEDIRGLLVEYEADSERVFSPARFYERLRPILHWCECPWGFSRSAGGVRRWTARVSVFPPFCQPPNRMERAEVKELQG